mgnify:CR=1 FL=1
MSSSVKRIEIMATYTFPVSIQTMIKEQAGTVIYYPQVIQLGNQYIQQIINMAIIEQVQNLIQQQYIEQGAESFSEMIGLYEIKTNERNILSLSLSNYAYAAQHAHGLTLMTSLTFDISTGKVYQLGDLFKRGSNYQEVLDELIDQQIKSRDIPVINQYPGILPDQDFYLADKALVIYYPLYMFTPYYYGFPMFPISVYELEGITNEKGPLGLLATNN